MLGKNISVETKAGSILGKVVTGILESVGTGYNVAKNFDPSIQSLHNQIFPYLDESDRVGLLDDTYMLIRVNDVIKVYAYSWLVTSTLKPTGPSKVQVTLLGPVDQKRLRTLLAVNGFTVESMGDIV